MGQTVAKTTIFTMVKDLELADSLSIYGKSLLYLIYHALEPETETPILGLDECLHADAGLRKRSASWARVPPSVALSSGRSRQATSGPMPPPRPRMAGLTTTRQR